MLWRKPPTQDGSCLRTDSIRIKPIWFCMEFATEESSMSGKRGLMGPSKNSQVQIIL